MEDKLKIAIENYAPSAETVELVRQSPLLLIVGISGAGKGTIKERLLQSGKYYNYVSHTTRQPRSNNGVMEVDGKDYHFISRNVALEMLQKGEFIEAKNYSGNVYGTSVEGLLRAKESNKIALNDIEVQGVEEYKGISDNVIVIFLLPPSYEEWQGRLLSRYGSDGVSGANMDLRMKTSIQELKFALSKDYFHFVINDDLEVAVAACDKIAHSGDKFFEKDFIAMDLAKRILADIEQTHE